VVVCEIPAEGYGVKINGAPTLCRLTDTIATLSGVLPKPQLVRSIARTYRLPSRPSSVIAIRAAATPSNRAN